MIRVDGSSYNNGIRFSATKYSVNFESYSNSTKMFLRKNEEPKVSKVLDFIMRIPLLRGIVSMIRNSKMLFFFLLYSLLYEIVSKTNSESKISLLLLSGLGFCFAVLLICYIIKKVLKNVKSTWQYHGAEHKVIFTNYEDIELTLENCRKAPRISEYCGTMLVALFLVIHLITKIIFILFFANQWVALQFLITWIISYELFLLDRNIPILCWIFKIGYWAQEHLFTKEPSDDQLNQAIEAFKLLERAETGQIPDDELQELLQNGKEISFLNKLF